MDNDNREYTEQVLPLIEKNFDLKNPSCKLEEIMDFTTRLEFAVTQNEDTMPLILRLYSQIHFN